MQEFDFWSEKLNHFFSSATPIKNNKINWDILKNRIIIILGQKSAGKSVIAEKLLNSYRTDERIEDIIKIYSDDYQYLLLSRNDDTEETFLSNRITTGIHAIDITLSIWEKLLQYKNKNKKYVILVENFERLNSINLAEFFKLINKYSYILPVITTSDRKLAKSIESQVKNRKSVFIDIPKITFSDLEKYKVNKKNIKKKSNIFEQLSRKSDAEVTLFLNMTKGVYGILNVLLMLTENKRVDQVDNNSLENFLIHLFRNQNGSYNHEDINRLILYFYMFNHYINFDILEKFYMDSSFDFISVLEDLEKNKILISEKEHFKLTEEIHSLAKYYVDNYSNKRLVRNTSFLIDHFIRDIHPEDYHFRAENAKYYKKQLGNIYLFLAILRTGVQHSTELNDEHNRLLKTINTPLHFDDNDHDLVIKHRINELKTTYSPMFHILEKAEYHYYYCILLLNYSYKRRVERFPKLRVELITLLDIYKKLKNEKEIEMQVKIGMLLSTQLVNVLNNEFLKDAIEIYKEIQTILSEKKYQENGFYDAYSIKLKLFSSCLLSPEESYEKLENLLEELTNKSSSYVMNETDLITLTLTNMLGVSFYLTNEFLNESLTTFKDNRNYTTDFSEKRYKLDNNVYLAEYLVNTSHTKASLKKVISNFNLIEKDSHIAQINLAGLYFYTDNPEKSKHLLTNVLNEEPEDDFYSYFCQYNLLILQLFSKECNLSEKTKLLKKLELLKIPALFQTKDIQNVFKKKTSHIIEYFKNDKRNNSNSITEIENTLTNEFDGQFPILQKLWQFSDYQYWI